MRVPPKKGELTLVRSICHSAMSSGCLSVAGPPYPPPKRDFWAPPKKTFLLSLFMHFWMFHAMLGCSKKNSPQMFYSPKIFSMSCEWSKARHNAAKHSSLFNFENCTLPFLIPDCFVFAGPDPGIRVQQTDRRNRQQVWPTRHSGQCQKQAESHQRGSSTLTLLTRFGFKMMQFSVYRTVTYTHTNKGAFQRRGRAATHAGECWDGASPVQDDNDNDGRVTYIHVQRQLRFQLRGLKSSFAGYSYAELGHIPLRYGNTI